MMYKTTECQSNKVSSIKVTNYFQLFPLKSLLDTIVPIALHPVPKAPSTAAIMISGNATDLPGPSSRKLPIKNFTKGEYLHDPFFGHSLATRIMSYLLITNAAY